jgi:co-chaperonin GroES (HSP10)
MQPTKALEQQPEVPFQPVHDRLLVEWEPESARVLSIWLPETARRPGALGTDRFLRIGRVVEAGPGDPCQRCSAKGHVVVEEIEGLPVTEECPVCHGAARVPMNVKVGDRVLYDHPSDKEVTIEGKQYVILHEQQHVLAVIEPEPPAFKVRTDLPVAHFQDGE